MSRSPEKSNDLLTTKLDIPSLGNTIVRRERLYKLLGAAGGSQVTLMVAPTGYGKTTLLVEWLSTIPKTRQHTAWVTLDPFDNSPQQFWTYICAAIQKVYSQFNFNPQTMLPIEYDLQDFNEVIPLINAIPRIPFRINLVLDDFQWVDHEYILQSIQYLIEHQPKNLHLIIATRSRPPLNFSRLRIQNRLVELSIRELSFTFHETNTFLSGLSGLTIDFDRIQALQKATEGWIAGLQIAVLSLKNQPEFQYPDEHLPDENDRVFSYLAEEILNHLEPEIQSFLLKTSILPDLCAPLCDTVLERSDSQDLLDRIEQKNLFLSVLDPVKRWYRYQPLFANAMAYHLSQSHPEDIPAIHRRACDWLCQNGYTDKAVSHALAVGDMDTAARIADTCALEAIKSFDMDRLIHWTNRFSLDLISKYPELGVYRALACFQLTMLDQVEPELQRVESALQERCKANGQNDPEDANIHWEIASIRAVMECTQGEVTHGFQTILELQENKPQVYSYFSGWLDHSLANVYHGLGDLASATPLYEAGRQYAARHDMVVGYMTSTSSLANLFKQQGCLQKAENECRKGLEYARGKSLMSWLTSLLYCYLMEIELERSLICQAEDRLDELVAFTHKTENTRTSFEHQISLYLSLANCFYLCQDAIRARQYAALAQDKLSKGQGISLDSVTFNRFQADIVDLHSRIWSATGEIKKLDAGFSDRYSSSDSSPLLHIAIQTALARIFLSQDNSSEALKILLNIEPQVRDIHFGRRLIEIQLLKALSYAADGDDERAFSTLMQAVDMAKGEGYLQIFLNEGEPARALFDRYITVYQKNHSETSSGKNRAHTQKIIQAFAEMKKKPDTTGQTGNHHTSILNPEQEALTEREQDVYSLLLNGKTTKEIAAELTISINTAKTHVWNIQRKLM